MGRSSLASLSGEREAWPGMYYIPSMTTFTFACVHAMVHVIDDWVVVLLDGTTKRFLCSFDGPRQLWSRSKVEVVSKSRTKPASTITIILILFDSRHAAQAR